MESALPRPSGTGRPVKPQLGRAGSRRSARRLSRHRPPMPGARIPARAAQGTPRGRQRAWQLCSCRPQGKWPNGEVLCGEPGRSPADGNSGQTNFCSQLRRPPSSLLLSLRLPGSWPPVALSCTRLPSSHRAPGGRDGAGCSRLPAPAASTRGRPSGSRPGRRSPRRVPDSRPRRAVQSPGGQALGRLLPAGSSGPAAAGRGGAGHGAAVRRRDEERRRRDARGRRPVTALRLDSFAAPEHLAREEGRGRLATGRPWAPPLGQAPPHPTAHGCVGSVRPACGEQRAGRGWSQPWLRGRWEPRRKLIGHCPLRSPLIPKVRPCKFRAAGDQASSSWLVISL